MTEGQVDQDNRIQKDRVGRGDARRKGGCRRGSRVKHPEDLSCSEHNLRGHLALKGDIQSQALTAAAFHHPPGGYPTPHTCTHRQTQLRRCCLLRQNHEPLMTVFVPGRDGEAPVVTTPVGHSSFMNTQLCTVQAQIT